jgi:hypothetical protein
MPVVTIRTIDGLAFLVVDGELQGRDQAANMTAGGVADIAAAYANLGITSAAQLLSDPETGSPELLDNFARGAGQMNFNGAPLVRETVDDA